jgi:hypothetical protein
MNSLRWYLLVYIVVPIFLLGLGFTGGYGVRKVHEGKERIESISKDYVKAYSVENCEEYRLQLLTIHNADLTLDLLGESNESPTPED